MNQSSQIMTFLLTTSLASLLALSLSHAQAVPEFDGATCVADNNCKDCNTGTATDPSCTTSGVRCTTSQGVNTQVTFLNCQPSGNSSDVCHTTSRANPNNEKCKQMKVWGCDCQVLFQDAYVCNGTGDCDCGAGGEEPDGTNQTLTLGSICVL